MKMKIRIQSFLLTFFCCLLVSGCSCKLQSEARQNSMWIALPDLPGASGAVSAHYAGMHNGMLLVAGGCNFPDTPAAEGGTKKYYDIIYALDTTDMSSGTWKEVGRLSAPVAYGASVSTSKGVVCLGGNNSTQSFSSVFMLSWNRDSQKIDCNNLPSLPYSIDNMAATVFGDSIYVAGGNQNGIPGCSFLRLDMNNITKGWEVLPEFPGVARLQPVLAAQKSASGVKIYLTGGFQPELKEAAPVLPIDLLSFNPQTNSWDSISSLPKLNDGTLRTLTGGCAVAYGDSALLFAGGVNYTIFRDAISRERNKKEAKAKGDTLLLNQLINEGLTYMFHPVLWYKFNQDFLCFNTYTGLWTNLGSFEQLSRAGAILVVYNKNILILGGELKPGIRTQKVNLFQL